MAKERPILFSGPMVRAILGGRKTQTRRVFTLPRGCSWYGELGGEGGGYWEDEKHPEGWWHVSEMESRFGAPGDRLWVKETFRFDDRAPQVPIYRADTHEGLEKRNGDAVWKPSIFMSRLASRITLEVTDVRVERLQDIRHKASELEAEGMSLSPTELYPNINRGSKLTEVFRRLWDKLNGERGFGWDANPWVWVVSFKPLAPIA